MKNRCLIVQCVNRLLIFEISDFLRYSKEMPRLELPEDAKQITRYGKHDLAGLYYSPSQRCFYNSYKIVRRVNIDGRNGFYTRMKSDAEKVRTLYISIAKLFKEYAELVDLIEWTKPERKPRAKKAATEATEKNDENENENDEKSEIKIDDDEPVEKPKKTKKSKKHGVEPDYDSAFKAMRNAVSSK